MVLWRVVAMLAVVGLLAVVALVPRGEGSGEGPAGRTEGDAGTQRRTADVWSGDTGGSSVTDRDGEWLSAVEVEGVACDGTGVDDLQMALDRAADEGLTLVLPRGAQCRTDEPLEIPGGTRIEAGGATVTGLPDEFRPRPERESLVDIIGVSDVRISGGVWRMARDEGANVFEIRDSRDVTLAGLSATGAREDGFYIGRPTNVGVTLTRVHAYQNGRSGISITTGRDVHVVDSQAHDNGHVLDMRGLAIEPNSAGGVLTGIRIVDFETADNVRSGAAVSLDNLEADAEDVDIVFERYRSVDEPIGLRVSSGLVGGSVRIVDAVFEGTTGVALQLKDRWASAFEVEILRPVVRDWGAEPTGEARRDSAISIFTSDDDVDEPLGGVRIMEPTITGHPDAGSDAYYVYVGDDRDDSAHVEDVAVLDPVLLQHGRGLRLEGDVRVGSSPVSDDLSRRGEAEPSGN